MNALYDLWMDSFGRDADYDTLEPETPNYYDQNGVKHIYVFDESECVIWEIKDGKMVKKYDRNMLPF